MLADSLSIVIPCKNEGLNMIQTLTLIPGDIKIIVADSSDDEITLNLLKDWMKLNPNLSIVEGGYPSIARNNGFELVKTPYVLFLDADISCEPTVLYKSLSVMLKKDLELVTCKFDTWESEYKYVYRFFDKIQWFTAKTKPFALGGFMLFKSSVFKNLGGFNPMDRVAEDYHLSSKIKPNKFAIIDQLVMTSGRRFKNKGLWYMFKLAINAWLNRNNETWFHGDQGYWT